jgi:hypothetical protein
VGGEVYSDKTFPFCRQNLHFHATAHPSTTIKATTAMSHIRTATFDTITSSTTAYITQHKVSDLHLEAPSIAQPVPIQRLNDGNDQRVWKTQKRKNVTAAGAKTPSKPLWENSIWVLGELDSGRIWP